MSAFTFTLLRFLSGALRAQYAYVGTGRGANLDDEALGFGVEGLGFRFKGFGFRV